MKKLFFLILAAQLVMLNGAKAQSNLINFNHNSSHLNKAAYELLDSLANYLKPGGRLNNFDLKLSSYACDYELEKNKLLGALRAIEIIDYLEKKHQLNRDRFVFIDARPDRLNKKNCNNEKTGIQFMPFTWECP